MSNKVFAFLPIPLTPTSVSKLFPNLGEEEMEDHLLISLGPYWLSVYSEPSILSLLKRHQQSKISEVKEAHTHAMAPEHPGEWSEKTDRQENSRPGSGDSEYLCVLQACKRGCDTSCPRQMRQSC